MNYVGLKMNHKAKFGKGVIIAQDASNRITVQFDTFSEPKEFAAPTCFISFLQLLDGAAEKQANAESQAHEAKAAEDKMKRQYEQSAKLLEQRMRSGQSDGSRNKKITIPRYASFDAFFDDQERLLTSEITYLRKNGGKRQKIVDGELVEFKNSIFIYAFESDSELNIPDNTQISLWKADSEIPATLVNSEEFTVIIATAANLGEHVSMIEFSSEPWRLLYYLIDHLKSLRTANSPIAQSLILDGTKQVQFNKEILTGQENAISALPSY